MDTRISIVVAVAENRVIGRDGRVPWRLRDDLRWFQKLTEGGTVIVGRKTHESIVQQLGYLLPDRKTIVLTRQEGYRAEGCSVVDSWEGALELGRSNEEIFVIGGEEIYRLALPVATRLYLTRVHTRVDGDTYFPEFDHSHWKFVKSEYHARDKRNKHPFTIERWERG